MIISCFNSELNFKVVFSDALLEKMIRLGKMYFPKEFGGILTGIKSEEHLIILDIEVPVKFESNKNGFVRHPDFLNDYLQEIFVKSNNQIEYLGEWHTHPNGSTQFSSQDLTSMKEIAENLDVNNVTPLLIILSINPSTDFQCYSFKSNQLIKLNE